MIFRKAEASELDAVVDIYEGVKGSEFCVWDDEYPTIREAAHDCETGNLYVLCDNCRIAGVLSVMPENEMNDMGCWRVCDGMQAEIARIAVSQEYRGRSLAGLMVDGITDILRSEGKRAIHISAAVGNLPALHTYKKRGFEIMLETDMYGGRYYLLEKLI